METIDLSKVKEIKDPELAKLGILVEIGVKVNEIVDWINDHS